MSYAMIGTWKMAMDGLIPAQPMLAGGVPVAQAIETAICAVEDNPAYVSLGYGGLPNSQCEVELDAAYMDGDSLLFGGIMGVQNIKNPIKVAIHLSKLRQNCLLSGKGAEQYAQHNGFEFTNMLTESSKERWRKSRDENPTAAGTAYAGHDTVCFIGADSGGHMGVGVSTSGLFMKHPGRVGDSPVIGSGFYCDSNVGGAVATGLGENIMKGCLSYEIVRRMREGAAPQQACEQVLTEHMDALRRRGYNLDTMAVIAMDPQGNFGAACNLESFAFVAANEALAPTVFIAVNRDGNITVAPATEKQLGTYVDA